VLINSLKFNIMLTLQKAYQPGAIGRIVTLHADFYSKLVGFGLPFEAKVARELTAFCENYDAERDGLWLAMKDGHIEASIAIDGAHATTDGAHLRWFIASDAARGSGIGTQLITLALEFCKSQHYKSVYLNTFAGLDAARHLYEKHGFNLVHEQRGVMWGAEVNEQRFEYNFRM
jgi:GNAT superfamily N-acetyltransferase